MILAIIIMAGVIIGLIFYIKTSHTSQKIQELKVDKGVAETKLKEAETEKEILIDHAADAKKETIKSKKELADAKANYVKNYNIDPNRLLSELRKRRANK